MKLSIENMQFLTSKFSNYSNPFFMNLLVFKKNHVRLPPQIMGAIAQLFQTIPS